MKTEKTEVGRSCVQGCFLGMLLFIVSLLMLSTAKTGRNFTEDTGNLVLFLSGEMAVGILFSLLGNRPRKAGKEGIRMFAGIGGMVLLYTAVFLFLNLASLFSEAVQMILGVNLLIFAVRETAEYYCIRRLSKELNETLSSSPRTLIIDLPRCPKTKAEYRTAIIRQAEKNHLTLNFITDDYPAVITLNNIPHIAEIESWYGFGGLEYSLKFREMPAGNKIGEEQGRFPK